MQPGVFATLCGVCVCVLEYTIIEAYKKKFTAFSSQLGNVLWSGYLLSMNNSDSRTLVSIKAGRILLHQNWVFKNEDELTE